MNFDICFRPRMICFIETERIAIFNGIRREEKIDFRARALKEKKLI